MLSFFDLPSVRRMGLVPSVAVLFLSYCASPVFSQNLTSTASLSGIVTDPQGARIGGATLTLLSLERGITRTFTTDSTGTFAFSLLPTAVYTLKVEISGFKKFQQDKITLEVGQSSNLNVSLAVGSATEQVEVSGQGPLLTTDNANLGSTVSEKQILDLPLNVRTPLSLVFLDSSVRNLNQGDSTGQDTADQDASFLSFGGQPMATTGFLLDGSYDGAMGWDGIVYSPSPDSIQEFKVQTNTYTAQYGLSMGNVVNVVTKSGSSQFHGDVYEFLRNDALDSNFYFNAGQPKTNLQMNQFGGSFGGPVDIPKIYKQKNKTFFFVLYEGLRLNGPTQMSTTVPTSNFKSGDLSALLSSQIGTDALCRPIFAGQIYNPFTVHQATATCATSNNAIGATVWIRDPIVGNNLSGMIDPVASNLLQYFPSPTSSGFSGINYFKAQTALTSSNEFTVRLDHNLTQSARLYGRFSRKGEAKVQSPDFWGANDPAGPGQSNPNNRYSIGLGYNQVFSPTMTGSFNFGFQRWVEGNVGQGYPFMPSTLGLPQQLDTFTPIFPRFDISGYASLGLSQQAAYPSNVGTISADFVKVLGTHSVSFGYVGVLTQLNGAQTPFTGFNFDPGFTSGPDPLNQTSGTGDGFASFLLGAASGGSAPVIIYPQDSKRYHGWYIQDDWKATKRLTLNLGMRYDIQFAPIEKHNRQAYFDPTTVDPVTSLLNNGTTYHGALVYNDSDNRGNYKTDFKNFSPRVGFAYQVAKSIVARGGFATFYPVSFLGYTGSPGYSQTTNYVASLDNIHVSSVLSNPFPQGLLQPVGNTLGGLTDVGQSISGVLSKERPSPYVEQWSFGLQYSFTHSDVLDATYVGNHGVHMVSSQGVNLNQLPPSDLALGNAALTALVANPFFGQPAVAASGCGLANATIPAFQLMLPMPQFCDSVRAAKGTSGESNYNALQVRYTHRAQGLTVSANYTYSKFLDDVAGSVGFVLWYPSTIRNSYNLKAERAVDVGNIPNAGVVSFIYELPVGRGKKFASGLGGPANAVLGGWQIAAINTFRQGTPFGTGSAATINQGTLFGGAQHPNLVGDPNVPGNFAGNPSCVGPSRVHTVAHWFNPCAFVQAGAGDFGNVPNYLSQARLPGYADTDLSISKWFNLTERFRLQFRGEMFNAFNHPNFGGPWPPQISSSSFSSLQYTDIPREVQFALKLYW
jgi:Carboxypeptidase regulatory-like domain